MFIIARHIPIGAFVMIAVVPQDVLAQWIAGFFPGAVCIWLPLGIRLAVMFAQLHVLLADL